VPVVDLVEVHLEDLGLRVHLLDAQRDHQLLELAVERAFVRQEQVPGQLLRDRRAALRGAQVQQVRQCRARDAAQVDAPVAVEVAVLGRERRVDERLRQRLERDDLAVFLEVGATSRPLTS
jgi:hypothetical protein